jgi:hypothetical protein
LQLRVSFFLTAVSGHDFAGISIEETLNVMDCTTPPNIFYDDLVPRHIQVVLLQI